MSELHAAIGVVELRRLESVLANRRRIAKWYDRVFDEMLAVTTFRPVEGCEPNYYKYIATFDTAEATSAFRAFARSKGFFLPGGVYDIPLHRQPIFDHFHDGRPFPNAEDFCSRHVALPVGRTMQREDVDNVAAVVQDFAYGHQH
jgi:dTDP-4-amino-4,6-dideoxygalactose transaminase